MHSVLVLGAGRSATALLQYLHKCHQQDGWHITVADASAALLHQKAALFPGLKISTLQLEDEAATASLIAQHQLVISLMPPSLHPVVGRHCLAAGKHLITASYLSPEMRALHTEAEAKGLTFLNECGLDPGIDHMSAMEVIDRLKAEGCQIHHFGSYCGGLIAPESDTNPWHYKITWNPMNVVLAGQGGVTKYRHQGQNKFVPYHRLFAEALPVEMRDLPVGTEVWSYPNRDSLPYRETYGLEAADTFIRGTLRLGGYCAGWLALIDLGYTENSYAYPYMAGMTMAQTTASFIPGARASHVKQHVQDFLKAGADDERLHLLEWLGLLSDAPWPGSESWTTTSPTPAQMLLALLAERWALASEDKDWVLMQHQFGYTDAAGKKHMLKSDLSMVGQDPLMTAMAMGVGYPLGIAARLILSGQVQQRGVCIPLSPQWYKPMLAELETLGVVFKHYHS